MDEKERQDWLNEIGFKARCATPHQMKAIVQSIACAIEEFEKGWCDAEVSLHSINRSLNVYLNVKTPMKSV